MDEQNNQPDAVPPSESPSPLEATPTDTVASEAVPTAESGEDSREADTKKAQATVNAGSDDESGVSGDHASLGELKRFHAVVNEVLASKEYLKLKALDIKTRPEFFQDWASESNRLLILLVNLKRRSTKQQKAGQKTSKAA